MASESKTIADISNDLRDWADRLPEDEDGGWFERPVEQMQEILRDIADKIDAAWKRERESLLPKQRENVNSGSAVYTGYNKGGNAAAMREALLALSAWVKIVKDHPKDKTATECAEFVEQAVNAALSAPPRNCDVGTAEEQEERWHKNCSPGIPNCKNCKVYDKGKESGLVDDIGFLRCSCRFVWAQMPYEEGGAK